MEAVVDLSQAGEFTATFHQTCSISHGEGLYLQCDLDQGVQPQLNELLKDLSGSVVISDANGVAVETARFDGGTAQIWEEAILLTGIAPFRTGRYVATVRVDRGARALAGRRQTIYAQYQLCGLEQMPAVIAGWFAFGAGSIGGVAAVIALPGLFRNGLWLDVQKSCGKPSAPSGEGA